jgi:hypothetical protein
MRVILMGLLDQFPNLDDETFEEIVKDSRLLIPQFARESWTDHNVHDPGITFLELFAWLIEMQIYQLNRVTENNYRKFLKLVGISPYDAQPSKVDITLDTKNLTFDENGDTILEKGTEVITEFNGKRIVFETEEEINLIQSNLAAIITRSNSQIIDNIDANKVDNIYFEAFGEKGGIGTTLELGFDKQLPKKEIQITFDLFDEDLPYLETDNSEPEPSVNLLWEYLSGGKWRELTIKSDTTLALNRSGRISFDISTDLEKKDDKYWIRCRWKDGLYEIAPLINSILLNTVPAVQTENVTKEEISTGCPDQIVRLEKTTVINRVIFDINDIQDWCGLLKQIKEQADSAWLSPGKEIWSKFDNGTQILIDEWEGEKEPDTRMKCAIIESLNKLLESRDLYDKDSFKDIDPDQLPKNILSKNMFNAPINEVRIFNRFLIEASFPDNEASDPGKIAKNRLVVKVCEKDKEEYWYEVDDFNSSGPDDSHYIFEPMRGEITFGNGLNGRIPPANDLISPIFTIRVSYKTTLGQNGNVPEGQKWIINKTGFKNILGENFKQATGGMDTESIEHAKSRAKKDFRAIYRAITSEDYEQLSLSTPGLRVARAKAIPNHDPEYPEINIPDSITVVIVPYTREDETTPVPGKGFLQTVSSFLETRRLITTNLHVIGPEYVTISVSCRVRLMKKSSPAEVIKRIQNELNKFLDPLKGGQDGKGWPFGRPVYPSEVYQIIDNLEGIDYASNVILSAESDNGHYKKVGDSVEISPIALVVSGEHKIEIIE